MDEVMVEHVLVAVEQIPAGCVASYGEVGALVGVGPRLVGRIMSEYGGDVTWWRVVNASGDLAPHLRQRAAAEWAAEGIVWKANRRGCRIADYRVEPVAWAEAYAAATRDLPPYP